MMGRTLFEQTSRQLLVVDGVKLDETFFGWVLPSLKIFLIKLITFSLFLKIQNVVPKVGLEPTQTYEYSLLRGACLPIPALGLTVDIIHNFVTFVKEFAYLPLFPSTII